ncbi:MAG: hypothetical protein HY898_02725 [Deltaproteobacteria bacterium]|nr:hypothetical protein [Deltaproteobacteria bacterium]
MRRNQLALVGTLGIVALLGTTRCGSEDPGGSTFPPGSGGSGHADAGVGGASAGHGGSVNWGTGGKAGSAGHGGSSSGTGGSIATTGGSAGSGPAGAGGAGGAGGSSYNFPDHACNHDPPANAPLPAAYPAYSGGACPTLAAGTNNITSSGVARQLQLALPANPPPQPGEKLPLVFLWHWMGGSGQSFINNAEVQKAVDQQRFVAIAPESGGSSKPPFRWPSTLLDSDARLQEELVFFDDMLTCAAQSIPAINHNCVSTAGVSAGGLWTAQVAGRRSQYLASFVSMSGGVGGGVAKPWANPSHRLPGLVLWGGACDQCSASGFTIHFQDTSKALESALAGQGNFLVECVHSCCHAEPPFEAPPGLSKYAGMWDFIFDHPYWLGAGESPYSGGIPFQKGLPHWCGPGPGSAPPPGALQCPGPAC